MNWSPGLALRKRIFTQEEVAAAVRANREQQTLWRWVMLGTTSTREYARSQLVVVQVAYVLGVALIYLAETITPTIERTLLHVWLGESIANLVVRMALFSRLMSLADPAQATRPLWRMVPPFNALVVGCHWAWTASISVGPSLTATTVTTLLVFLLMSISAMTIAPASPLAAGLYLLFLWVPMSFALMHSNWVGSNMVVVLLIGIVAVLSVGLWLTVGPAWRYLNKSDQVELLIGELHQRNAELEELRADAAAELRTRSQFFTGASHDFKQRLHAMKLLAHAAREGEPNVPSPSQTKLGAAMEDLERYISDVLEFARLENRALKPTLRGTALQDVFQAVAVQFEEIAATRGVDLKFRTTSAHLDTDEAMLLRILENLVSNAIKFTRQRVVVAARPHQGGWSIEVWDQGPGIEPGAENVIFEAFYQSKVYVDHRQEGVGLGLAIVRRLADCLGYSVRVQSTAGKGSVLKVVIPAKSSERITSHDHRNEAGETPGRGEQRSRSSELERKDLGGDVRTSIRPPTLDPRISVSE